MSTWWVASFKQCKIGRIRGKNQKSAMDISMDKMTYSHNVLIVNYLCGASFMRDDYC